MVYFGVVSYKYKYFININSTSFGGQKSTKRSHIYPLTLARTSMNY